MSRRLDDLSLRFRPLAERLIAQIVEAKIAPIIVFTGRTQAEQDAAFASGASKVRYSRHQDGDAIDLAPYAIYQLAGEDKVNWDTKSPEAVRAWKQMGAIGEKLGLRWGGRFKPLDPDTGLGWDPGHFEYIIPVVPTLRNT